MALPPWRILRQGASGLVATIDFTQFRTEAGFRELSRSLTVEHTVVALSTEAPEGDLRSATEPSWFVARWVEHLRDQPPAAVLGYCAGGFLAVHLAAALDVDRPVVLFEPMAVTGEVLRICFDHAVESFAAHVPADQVSDARRSVARACTGVGEAPGVDERMISAAETVCAHYRIILDTACGGLGVSSTVANKMFGHFRDHIVYQVAGHRAQEALVDRAAVAMISEDHPAPAEPTVTWRRFTSSSRDLLAAAEVAATVDKHISSAITAEEIKR